MNVAECFTNQTAGHARERDLVRGLGIRKLQTRPAFTALV